MAVAKVFKDGHYIYKVVIDGKGLEGEYDSKGEAQSHDPTFEPPKIVLKERNERLVPGGWAAKGYGSHVLARYGINMRDVTDMYKKQEGRCAGCKREIAHPEGKISTMKLRPEVDHDHKTGKVRGLLCRRCNDFLGKVEDNVDVLDNLSAYVKESR